MNDDSKPADSAKNGAAPAEGEAGQAAADLWAVSYADDDDRELTSSQIADAIERGEINGDTIVWRPGMEDWEPLSGRPELAPLLERTEEPAPLPPAPKSSQPPLALLPEDVPARPAPRFRPHVAVAALGAAALLLIVVWSSTRRPDLAPSAASVEQQASLAPAPPSITTQTSAATATAAAASGAVEQATASASVAPPPGAPDYFAFDKLRAMRQLAALAEKAARCRGRGTPSGTVRAMVTFEPSGGAPSSVRVTQAPYAGTPTARCVVKKLSTASVPAFKGPAVTLRVPVELR